MSEKIYLMDRSAESESNYWFALTAELTDNQELIIQYICRYDGDLPQAPEPDETHRAIVDQEDTLLMAKYLQVTIDELLGVIDEEFADSRPSVDSMDAADCFADILDFILDCGAKYKLK